MAIFEPFDYAQPTRDALAGIYVEATDEPSEQPGDIAPARACSSAALFGLTRTVDDTAANGTEQLNRVCDHGGRGPEFS